MCNSPFWLSASADSNESIASSRSCGFGNCLLLRLLLFLLIGVGRCAARLAATSGRRRLAARRPFGIGRCRGTLGTTSSRFGLVTFGFVVFGAGCFFGIFRIIGVGFLRHRLLVGWSLSGLCRRCKCEKCEGTEEKKLFHSVVEFLNALKRPEGRLSGQDTNSLGMYLETRKDFTIFSLPVASVRIEEDTLERWQSGMQQPAKRPILVPEFESRSLHNRKASVLALAFLRPKNELGRADN